VDANSSFKDRLLVFKREIGSRVGSCAAVIEAKVNPGVSFQHSPWVAHYRGRSAFARETVAIFSVETLLWTVRRAYDPHNARLQAIGT
jgi:hypothetical protein